MLCPKQGPRRPMALLRFPSRIGVWDPANKRTKASTSCFGGPHASSTILDDAIFTGSARRVRSRKTRLSAAECALLALKAFDYWWVFLLLMEPPLQEPSPHAQQQEHETSSSAARVPTTAQMRAFFLSLRSRHDNFAADHTCLLP